ncbi:MAG TPA: ATP synthase F1 subunit delta [Candidatus Tumulicola sp.]
MASEKLARRYASAIFGLATDRGITEKVGDDLLRIRAVLDGDAGINTFFVAPIVDRQDKESALTAAFGKGVDELALHSMLLMVRKRREALFSEVVDEYQKLQLASRGEEPIVLTSAKALSNDELEKTVARLQALFGKKFEVKQVVDPNVIGGVRILMGDRRIDGTVAGRLDTLARTLFASN